MKYILTIFVTIAFICAWFIEPIVLKQPHNKLDYFLASIGFITCNIIVWVLF